MNTKTIATRLTVPVLVGIAHDLGRQQAALDADGAGRRNVADLDPASELNAWRKSGREADDQGVIDAVDRYHALAPRTRARIGQAYLDGYSGA
jgi:hypothetical protein